MKSVKNTNKSGNNRKVIKKAFKIIIVLAIAIGVTITALAGSAIASRASEINIASVNEGSTDDGLVPMIMTFVGSIFDGEGEEHTGLITGVIEGADEEAGNSAGKEGVVIESEDAELDLGALGEDETVDLDNLEPETETVKGQKIYYARATFFDVHTDTQITSKSSRVKVGTISDGATIGFCNKWNHKMLSTYNFGDPTKTPAKYPQYAGSFWESSYQSSWAYGIYNGLSDRVNESSNWWSSACRGTVAKSVTQGLVHDELLLVDGEGFIAMANEDNGKYAVLPYFDKDFLTNNTHNNSNTPLGTVKEEVDFPLRVTKRNGIYEYQFYSNYDVARFNNAGELEYRGYCDWREYVTSAEGLVSFLPYNKRTDSTARQNFVYSVKVDIPVYIPEGGTYKGQDLIFEFDGDDDVYVFLDGHMILDLGGGHGEVGGEVNFAEQVSTVAKVANNDFLFSKRALFMTQQTDYYTINGTRYLTAFYNKETPFSEEVIESLKNTDEPHVLTLFYMERAKGSANLKMKFNLPVADRITDITDFKNGSDTLDVGNGANDETNSVILFGLH